jgi:3-hydroxyacyl-[acyl-carrier-protein] dehydratase
MVLNSLFKVKDFSASDSEIKATLQVNASHEIFSGHFPGQPVVPGVTMMQAVKELVERALNKKLNLREADNMKFLSVMDPLVISEVQATISLTDQAAQVTITASLFASNVTFFKLKAVLTPAIPTE